MLGILIGIAVGWDVVGVLIMLVWVLDKHPEAALFLLIAVFLSMLFGSAGYAWYNGQ